MSEDSIMLVLIRGLPGSGKSTMARVPQQSGFVWLEADSYHLNDEGEYCHSPANVKAAHEWSQRETFKALANGKRVVVSNTFTRRFEMAKSFGIEPNILEATGDWPNVHGVPVEAVEKMRQRWEKSSNTRVKPEPQRRGIMSYTPRTPGKMPFGTVPRFRYSVSRDELENLITRTVECEDRLSVMSIGDIMMMYTASETIRAVDEAIERMMG